MVVKGCKLDGVSPLEQGQRRGGKEVLVELTADHETDDTVVGMLLGQRAILVGDAGAPFAVSDVFLEGVFLGGFGGRVDELVDEEEDCGTGGEVFGEEGEGDGLEEHANGEKSGELGVDLEDGEEREDFEVCLFYRRGEKGEELGGERRHDLVVFHVG